MVFGKTVARLQHGLLNPSESRSSWQIPETP